MNRFSDGGSIPPTSTKKSIDFVGAFLNEIRLTTSEILLRNMK